MSQMRLIFTDPLSSCRPTPRDEAGPTTRRDQLQHLQKVAVEFRKIFNARRLAFQDWHAKKMQSFVNSLKQIQTLGTSLSEPNIHCISDFRDIRALAFDLTKNGRLRFDLSTIEDYLNMWKDFLDKKEELQSRLVKPLHSLLQQTCEFRNPEGRQVILDDMKSLEVESHEEFDFRELHNTKENLFTYKLALKDEKFLGLIQILPRLHQTAARLCYYTEKLVLNSVE